MRAEVRRGGGAFRSHGRITIPRVHGADRCRRRHGGKLREVRLCREPGKGDINASSAVDLPGDGAPEEVHTPGLKTIDEVAKFLGVSPTQKIKTLALMQMEDDKKHPGEKRVRPVIVLLRGDHSLNEAKLSTALGGKEFRPMHEEEIRRVFGSPAGFLGPVKSQPWPAESRLVRPPRSCSWIRCRWYLLICHSKAART